MDELKKGDLIMFTAFKMFPTAFKMFPSQRSVFKELGLLQDAYECVGIFDSFKLDEEGNNVLVMHRVIWSEHEEWRAVGGEYVLTKEQFEAVKKIVPTKAQMLVWGV